MKAKGWWRVAGALMLFLAPGASAQVVIFNSGLPDGRMGMASRQGPGPGSGANQETEAADDFILSSSKTLVGGAFAGLLPLGTTPANVSQVTVEIYRVFPLDSTNPPSGNVPTRVNSPSDVEFADRASAAANLSFSTFLVNPRFTVLNSVDTGIHPLPNQTTGGDGPVTGQEVLFGFDFLTPMSLPAGHYFFVPQVLLSNPNDHFLWLSAPKPISGPGTTPFSPDLQAWIRNADLDPDWLRVGTDIVGPPATGGSAPTFNGSFAILAVPEPSGALPLVFGSAIGLGFVLRKTRR